MQRIFARTSSSGTNRGCSYGDAISVVRYNSIIKRKFTRKSVVIGVCRALFDDASVSVCVVPSGLINH